MLFAPRLLLILAIALAPLCSAQAQPAGRRVALVIGNGAYRSVQRLANPAADARLVASTLRAQGFEVIGGDARTDLDRSAFANAVQTFGQKLQGAEIAVFYYAGHGMQVQGANWLVPTDARPTRIEDLDTQMINAATILNAMQAAGTKLNVVVLDACRDNPFPGLQPSGGETGLAQMRMTGAAGGRSLSAGPGLAQMRAPEGTIIAFATQPGSVAMDGSGADSPFTTALVDTFRQPGLDVLAMFNRIGVMVKRATGGAQQPWVSASPIDGEYYFGGEGSMQPIPIATAVPVVARQASGLAQRIAVLAAPANIPLPETIAITPPAADVPPDMARFSGVWGPGQWAGRYGSDDFMLIVEAVDSQGIAVVLQMDSGACANSGCGARERRITRHGAVIRDGVMSFTSIASQRHFDYRLGTNGVMIGIQTAGRGSLATRLSRIE